MNATELFLKDGKPTGVWFCSKCRNVAPSQHLAEQCCQNYKCEDCGQDVGSRSWLVCAPCRTLREERRERERFEKAEKLTDWKGWVYLDGWGNSGFYSSIEDFLDACVDLTPSEIPEYVWACRPNHFVHAEVSDITERMDDAYEDFDTNDLNGLDDLRKALEQFNEANKDMIAYEPDYTKAVVILREVKQ